MTDDFTPHDRISQPGRSEGARTLLAPLAGLGAAAAALLAFEEEAEAGRRQRIRARREREDERDDRRDDRRDDHQDHHGRNDRHDDAWGGSTEGGSVSRTPGSHIRNDFDAWS